ncbi:MAG: hypothetical protein NVS3B20_12730 [Polyangiales bacterium]
MSPDPIDPIRLDRVGEAPVHAIEALREARLDAPSPARLAAIEASVMAKLAPSSGGGSGASAGPNHAPRAARLRLTPAGTLRAIVGAIVGGGSVVALVIASRS